MSMKKNDKTKNFKGFIMAKKFKVGLYQSEIMHLKLNMAGIRAQKKRNLELMQFFRHKRKKEEVIRLQGMNDGLSWIHYINDVVLSFLEKEIKKLYPKDAKTEGKQKQA